MLFKSISNIIKQNKQKIENVKYAILNCKKIDYNIQFFTHLHIYRI